MQAASVAAAVAVAIAMTCFFCSFSVSNMVCTAGDMVAIASVEFESLEAGAVAEDLRKLHLLFSFGVVCWIEIGVVGSVSMAMEEEF